MEKGELKEYRLALLGDVLLEMETAKALPVDTNWLLKFRK